MAHPPTQGGLRTVQVGLLVPAAPAKRTALGGLQESERLLARMADAAEVERERAESAVGLDSSLEAARHNLAAATSESQVIIPLFTI